MLAGALRRSCWYGRCGGAADWPGHCGGAADWPGVVAERLLAWAPLLGVCWQRHYGEEPSGKQCWKGRRCEDPSGINCWQGREHHREESYLTNGVQLLLLCCIFAGKRQVAEVPAVPGDTGVRISACSAWKDCRGAKAFGRELWRICFACNK